MELESVLTVKHSSKLVLSSLLDSTLNTLSSVDPWCGRGSSGMRSDDVAQGTWYVLGATRTHLGCNSLCSFPGATTHLYGV